MDDYTNALFLQTSIPSGRYTTQNYIALYKYNGKLQYFKLLLFVMYFTFIPNHNDETLLAERHIYLKIRYR